MTIESSWTSEDLRKLEKAIAQGVLRVKYTDKEVEYRTLSDMFTIRERIKKSLSGSSKLKSFTVISSKGLC